MLPSAAAECIKRRSCESSFKIRRSMSCVNFRSIVTFSNPADIIRLAEPPRSPTTSSLWSSPPVARFSSAPTWPGSFTMARRLSAWGSRRDPSSTRSWPQWSSLTQVSQVPSRMIEVLAGAGSQWSHQNKCSWYLQHLRDEGSYLPNCETNLVIVLR